MGSQPPRYYKLYNKTRVSQLMEEDNSDFFGVLLLQGDTMLGHPAPVHPKLPRACFLELQGCPQPAQPLRVCTMARGVVL